ncbi:6,7-dimethyl-8-ribityllumazine synthase, partial [Candidatus Entotheonella palauensis]
MPRVVEGSLSAAGMSFSIIVSRFNDFITSHLLDGAVGAFVRHGASDDQITVYWAPGAFEIPQLAHKLVQSGRAGDAIVCLGCVIRGATPHFDYVAGEAAKGIA